MSNPLAKRQSADNNASFPIRLVAIMVTAIAMLPRKMSRGAWWKSVLTRRFAFTFVTTAIMAAKIIHVIAHRKAFSKRNLATWSFSFFAQDLFLIIFLRVTVDIRDYMPEKQQLLRAVAAVYQCAAVAFATVVSIVNITFYFCSRSEMRWRNVDFAKSSSSRGVLLSGLGTFTLILVLLTAFSAIFQHAVYGFFGVAIDVVKWPFRCCTGRSNQYKNHEYSKLADDPFTQITVPVDPADDRRSQLLAALYLESNPYGQYLYKLVQGIWAVALSLQLLACVTRPSEGSLTYMSWTTPIIPFVDFKDTASSLQVLRPVFDSSIGLSWDNVTALEKPKRFSWLPDDKVLKGFEDWYGAANISHYNVASDPLKKSNVNQDILAELKDSLRDTPIKHIVWLVMESTRKDVFPFKKDGLIWNIFTEASQEGQISQEGVELLKSLTPTANFVTGDYDDGFEHKSKPKRGGLNMRNAYTTATYTRKSMLGMMCGISPLVADFNMEYLHHIYQPCLPHMLEAFSFLDQGNDTSPKSSKWTARYLQTTTLGYDHSDTSTQQFGFKPENMIGAQYLRSDKAKFGKVDLPNINYFGFQEMPLLDYVRDAFVTAKEKEERLFLTHLTSTTHHPYNLPRNETYVPFADGRLSYLSHYVNTVGYDDKWLGSVLNVIEEEGVANETLVIFTGDHGVSLPENDKPSSFYNPNAGCNHVPMVISHPKLPPINVDDAVSTMDLLPTVLDLLRETDSLSDAAYDAAGDLLANSEGHSLIREPADIKPTDASRWRFVVMSPGRAMLGIRDITKKHWRLVVPVIHNIEWRFTDLETDPTDTNAVQAFDYTGFLTRIEEQHGREQAMWAEEATFVARWWVEENNKRWQYGQYSSEQN